MVKIKTTKLQKMLAKVIKCASNNKLFPITTLISVKVDNDKLLLTTTDGTNYMRMYTTEVEISDSNSQEAVISVDTFNKLIMKLTSDYTKIAIDTNTVKIEGNGKYDLPIQTEDDESITYPFPKLQNENNSCEIELSEVRKTLANIKPSLATTLELPALTGYYATNNSVIGSDSFVVAKFDTTITNVDVLYSTRFIDLLASLDDEKITLKYFDDNYIRVESGSVTIIGKTMEEFVDYPIDAINNFVTMQFTNNVTLDKTALIDVLDRLSIFVSDYDNRAVHIDFTKDMCNIYNKKESAVEKLPYINSNITDELKILIDVEILKSQLNSFANGGVQIDYSIDSPAIRLTADKLIKVIALMDMDDNE